MLKKIYEKTLKLARHRRARFFLGVISFSESSFFPIPPDIMIIPMSVAKKNDFLKIAFIATVFSTLGGLFGYFIGSLFTDKAMLIMEFYGYEEQIVNLKKQLSSKGSGIFSIWLGTLFLAGFTPLPFKLFTITSGIINFNIFIFFIICFVSRGLRFFIVAYLSIKFGSVAASIIEKKGSKWFSIMGIIIVIIAAIIYFIFK